MFSFLFQILCIHTQGKQMTQKPYREGFDSTATHNGKEYRLDTLFELIQNRSIVNVEVSKISWVLEYTDLDSDRVMQSDTGIPVLVYKDPEYGFTVIDGAHRLTKAVKLGLKTLPAYMLTDEDMRKAEVANINLLAESNKVSKKITWDPRFAPSYTPEEMLKLGVFEGKYINAVKGVPASWKKIPKVLGPDDEPDPKLNYFGVKSRQPLSTWKKNGWIRTDKWGWFEFFINYYLGRRLGAEDDWQIGRWVSFVARHSGQLKANPKSKGADQWLKSKQGLLQWGWDAGTSFTDEQREKNAKRIARIAGVPLAEEKEEDKKKVAQESLIMVPRYTNW